MLCFFYILEAMREILEALAPVFSLNCKHSIISVLLSVFIFHSSSTTLLSPFSKLLEGFDGKAYTSPADAFI